MVEHGIAGPRVTGSIPVWSFFLCFLGGFQKEGEEKGGGKKIMDGYEKWVNRLNINLGVDIIIFSYNKYEESEERNSLETIFQRGIKKIYSND